MSGKRAFIHTYLKRVRRQRRLRVAAVFGMTALAALAAALSMSGMLKALTGDDVRTAVALVAIGVFLLAMLATAGLMATASDMVQSARRVPWTMSGDGVPGFVVMVDEMPGRPSGPDPFAEAVNRQLRQDLEKLVRTGRDSRTNPDLLLPAPQRGHADDLPHPADSTFGVNRPDSGGPDAGSPAP